VYAAQSGPPITQNKRFKKIESHNALTEKLQTVSFHKQTQQLWHSGKKVFFWLSLRKLKFILENHLFTADFATLSAKFQIILANNSLDNSAHYYNPTPLARSCFLGLKIV
jgi:hypothetical protein